MGKLRQHAAPSGREWARWCGGAAGTTRSHNRTPGWRRRNLRRTRAAAVPKQLGPRTTLTPSPSTGTHHGRPATATSETPSPTADVAGALDPLAYLCRLQEESDCGFTATCPPGSATIAPWLAPSPRTPRRFSTPAIAAQPHAWLTTPRAPGPRLPAAHQIAGNSERTRTGLRRLVSIDEGPAPEDSGEVAPRFALHQE